MRVQLTARVTIRVDETKVAKWRLVALGWCAKILGVPLSSTDPVVTIEPPK